MVLNMEWELENKWKEYKKLIEKAVIEKNELYYELIEKGILIKVYEKKDSEIETELESIFFEE
nr:MAG TPA: hypothetical protein [Caudoviricetes sp.]